MADEVRSTTTALGDIVALLRGTGQGQWRGRSAEAFRERFDDDFKPKVEQVHESFLTAAQALEEWAGFVPGEQRAALALEEQAQAIQTSLDTLPPAPSWNELLGREDDQGDEADEAEAERAAQERMRLLQERQRLQDQLAALRERAERLRESFIEYGDDIADRIARAMAMAPNEPGFFSRLGGMLVDAANDIVESIGEIASGLRDWIVENARHIAVIGDVLAVVSTVAGAAALVAYGIAPFTGGSTGLIGSGLGELSVGFAAGALICHGVARLAGADVSWRTIGQDALGAIPVVGVFSRVGGTIGRTASAIKESPITKGLGNIALVDSLNGMFGSSTSISDLLLQDPSLWPNSEVTGGALLIGFENAWRPGGAVGAGERAGIAGREDVTGSAETAEPNGSPM
ncbi:hypothetical protein K4G22_22305 [Streptomyces profundus]|nr:hypothetical protein [Streptomyces sp. MA3_2.13]UED86586.1 hypothetical protein K4G22_22305 [Streptomyces sp. MA3_2.13]